jgi:hypothetical protein
VHLILQDAAEPGAGWRTHACHLRTLSTFLNLLQAVVQDRITTHLQTVVQQGEHVSLGMLGQNRPGRLVHANAEVVQAAQE